MRLGKDLDNSWSTAFSSTTGQSFTDPLEPFSNAYGNTRRPEGTYYTNAELVELYDPLRPELPYIFDDLEWSHCAF